MLIKKWLLLFVVKQEDRVIVMQSRKNRSVCTNLWRGVHNNHRGTGTCGSAWAANNWSRDRNSNLWANHRHLIAQITQAEWLLPGGQPGRERTAAQPPTSTPAPTADTSPTVPSPGNARAINQCNLCYHE